MAPDAPTAAAVSGGRHPLPELVADGIWVVRIPLHVRVDPVNAYVLLDRDGGILVFDTGIAPDADLLWRSTLAAIGHEPADVRRIVVSHHHPDHIGGAGALHRLTGAPVLASRSTIRQAPDVWGDAGRMDGYMASIRAHLHEHGLPEEVAERLDQELELARAAVDLPPEDAWQELADGDRLEVGDRQWRVRLTPGHADGHIVLQDEAERLLLAGDHLLERISPAVGRFPRHERDPLARYMESLVAIAMADPGLVLPGHGAPFGGAAERARALMRHHVERIESCVAAVRQLGAATAYDVARRVFAHVFAAAEPDAANQRFATTESLAHLERARFEGRLLRQCDGDGLVRFRPVGDG